MLKNILQIVAFTTEKWDSMQDWLKEWKRKRYEKKVNEAFDNLDLDAIDKLVRDIRKKREDRRDSSGNAND